MSSGGEWSGGRGGPKRGRAGEEKTSDGQGAAGGRPSGEEDSRFRGSYSDYPNIFPPSGEGQYGMHPMHAYQTGPGGPPQWPHAPFHPPMGYGMYSPYQPGYPPPPYPGVPGGPSMPPPYYTDHAQAAAAAAHARGYPPEMSGQSQVVAGGQGAPPAPSQYEEDRAAAAPAASRDGEHAAPAASSYGIEDDGNADESSEQQDYDDESETKGPDTSSASRARLYVKSKVPTRQEILDRRARKNAQSRARAQKLRERMEIIQMKPESERTEEEQELFNSYQYRRQRKNDRSRERAIEKKQEIDRILSKPENKRTKIENEFLEIALSAKQRKNQGDRLRRQRLKQMKRAQARAESDYAGQQSRMGYPSGMSEIPMSPLPGASHHASMASPGMPSPGMGITFPSPSNTRQPQGPSGAQAGSGVPLPFVPPSQTYGTGDSPAARSQLHMPQSSTSVEQRRNADGSMSISIGGRSNAGEGAAYAEGAESGAGSSTALNVSQLLEYGENNEEQEGDNGE